MSLFAAPLTAKDEKETLVDISMGSFMVCATLRHEHIKLAHC
jgi:hypothetical protein